MPGHIARSTRYAKAAQRNGVCSRIDQQGATPFWIAWALLFAFLVLVTLCLVPGSGHTAELHLTAAERAFIARGHDIVLGTDESWMPYVVVDEEGRLTGHDVELIDRINALTGLRLRLKVGAWRDLIEQVKRREIDGLSAGGIHPEREVFMNFSDIYFSLNKMLLVRSDNPSRILTPDDLAGKTIAIHRGNLVDEKIADRFGDSTILRTETVEEMIQAVVSGQADATFGNGATLFVADHIGLPYLRTGLSPCVRQPHDVGVAWVRTVLLYGPA